jgi:hypothetical protein
MQVSGRACYPSILKYGWLGLQNQITRDRDGCAALLFTISLNISKTISEFVLSKLSVGSPNIIMAGSLVAFFSGVAHFDHFSVTEPALSAYTRYSLSAIILPKHTHFQQYFFSRSGRLSFCYMRFQTIGKKKTQGHTFYEQLPALFKIGWQLKFCHRYLNSAYSLVFKDY